MLETFRSGIPDLPTVNPGKAGAHPDVYPSGYEKGEDWPKAVYV